MTEIDHNISELVSQCGGGLWEDKDFPMNEENIFGSKGGDMSEVEILRISEIADDPQLFVGGVDAGDIKQGDVGDCWFLSALAVMAERIDLLKQVIYAEAAENGIYQFRFWKNGTWKVVTVDDRLAVIAGTKQPYFAHCSSPNEFWVPLLEKAYAKAHGNYQRLNQGYMGYAFSDMTGGCPEQFEWRTDKTLLEDGTIQAKLEQAQEESWLMGCSWQSSDQGSKDCGLITNHAYSILRVVTASNDEVMVNLRNPWGEGEWNGDWSDQSDKWTDELKQELEWSDADDGSFWMCMKDFGEYFTKIMICRLYHDGDGEMWKRYVHANEWTEESGGSLNDHEAWKKNPQYEIVVEEETALYATLCQEDRRVLGKPHEEYFHIALRVYTPTDEHFVDGPILKPKADTEGEKEEEPEKEEELEDGWSPGGSEEDDAGDDLAEEEPADEDEEAADEEAADEDEAPADDAAEGDAPAAGGAAAAPANGGEPTRRMQRGCHEHIGEKFKYINSRDTGVEVQSLAPGKYMLMPTTFEAGQACPYVLQIFSQKPVTITYLGVDGTEEELEETPMPESKNADNMDDDM